MTLFHLISEYGHYVPFIMFGFNILSRIIFAVAVIAPAIRGAVVFTYHISYVLIIGSYLLARNLIRYIKKIT